MTSENIIHNELVGTVAETVHEAASGPHEPFYLEAEFWVAVAVVLVVAGLAKPVGKIINGLLHKRIKGIADRIDEAAQIRADAQRLLADYERKFGNVENEAYQIIEKSKREIEFIRKEKLDKLERELKLKEKEAVNRIERASSKAVEEVAVMSSDMAVEAVKEALRRRITDKVKDKLIEQSIAELEKVG